MRLGAEAAAASPVAGDDSVCYACIKFYLCSTNSVTLCWHPPAKNKHINVLIIEI